MEVAAEGARGMTETLGALVAEAPACDVISAEVWLCKLGHLARGRRECVLLGRPGALPPDDEPHCRVMDVLRPESGRLRVDVGRGDGEDLRPGLILVELRAVDGLDDSC